LRTQTRGGCPRCPPVTCAVCWRCPRTRWVSDGDDRPRDRRGGPWWPPASRPRAVEGGLKARSTRGAIAQTWWSGRFIAVLESIIVGGRLERGRNYARRGQVLSMDVTAGPLSGP